MTLFATVAELAEEMAATSSRLKKRAAIAQAIVATRAADPSGDDAALFALYLAGTPFAESDPRKLSTGGALLTKAVLAVSNATDAALTAAYRRHGDLGAAAFDLLAHNPERPATLTLTAVAEAFAAMAIARTTAVRSVLVEDLLRRGTPPEAKYLIKLMLGDMRIGVKQSLVEEAIAAAASTPQAPVSPAQVRHAVMLEADLGSAVRRAFAGTLADACMRLFHPLGFMLASPVDSPEEAISRFTGDQPAADNLRVPHSSQPHGDGWEPKEDNRPAPAPILAFLEDKYDGMRAQVHCGDPNQPGRVAIYSRNREDITASFPELSEAFAHVNPATGDPPLGPLILDGEILGVPHSSQPHREEWGLTEPHALPFAVLGQRIGRKRVSNEWRARVPVIFMAFDLLYAGGELILNLPLSDRRNRLEAVLERLIDRTLSPLELAAPEPAQATLFSVDTLGAPHLASEMGEGVTATISASTPLPRLMLSPARLVASAEDVDRAYAAARARANEGVMIKAADSTYQPGRRGLAWLKLKRELATLDVVITGAEYGHGKRAGLLSDYTFAVRRGASPTSEGEPEAFAEGEDPAELLNVGKAYSGVTDQEIAELTTFLKAHTLEDQGHFRLVEPLIVLEVAFNNIMRSPRHSSGFALRFPRILRLRPDKPLAEIDTLARVEAIYQSQIDKPER
jgi:DNA ligase-1